MIAIDMPMPRSCEECPLMVMRIFYTEKYCRVKDEIVGSAKKKAKRRPSWCPLIDLTDDGK
jgi:hypothetical protein